MNSREGGGAIPGAKPGLRALGASARYIVHSQLAVGGAGTVSLAAAEGAGGFTRPVALKRLHPAVSQTEEMVAMLLDEARILALVRHPNIVPVIDVLEGADGFSLVLEYVHGGAVSELVAASGGRAIAPSIAAAIVGDMLVGLHAAHEAKGPDGEPLLVVHRDVSPQNVLVGVDGISRVADFGIAKARDRSRTTEDGAIRGKLSYMAPEQFDDRRTPKDRRMDIYAAGAVLWELLTGEVLHSGTPSQIMAKILLGRIDPPSQVAKGSPKELDAITLRALASDPKERFSTALEMARAIRAAVAPADAEEVGAWVSELLGPKLIQRQKVVERILKGEPPSEDKAPLPMAPATSATRALAAPQATAEEAPRDAPEKLDARRWWWLAGTIAAVGVATSAYALSSPAAPRELKQSPAVHVLAAASAVLFPNSGAVPPSSSEIVPPSPTASHRAAPAANPKQRPHVRGGARSCSPPYVEEANGFRRPKPECI